MTPSELIHRPAFGAVTSLWAPLLVPTCAAGHGCSTLVTL